MLDIIASVLITLISIGGVALIVCFYFLIRNELVYRFIIRTLYTESRTVYLSLPDYDKMLYSVKPLKLKYWIENPPA